MLIICIKSYYQNKREIPGYRYVSMVGIVKIGVVTFIFLYIRVYK